MITKVHFLEQTFNEPEFMKAGKVDTSKYRVTCSTYGAEGGVNVFVKYRRTGEVVFKQFFTTEQVMTKAKSKKQILKSSTTELIIVGRLKRTKKPGWKTTVKSYRKFTMTFEKWIVSPHASDWIFKQLLEEFLNDLQAHHNLQESAAPQKKLISTSYAKAKRIAA